MKWNWQQPGWGDFSWEASRLARAEAEFLVRGGGLAGAMLHLGVEEAERVRLEAMTEEAVTTSRIEGEILDRASVRSSLRKYLGLAQDRKIAKPGEQGVAEMTADLHRGHAAALNQQTLFSWHEMVMRGRTDVEPVGAYRTHASPMQIVSGRSDRPRVHFEAPVSKAVRGEMRRFVEWFNATKPGSEGALPAVTRAGLAHLYFESIHPFEDGNGRVGRAIAEKALAQGLGGPSLVALAGRMLARRKEYYAALEEASQSNEVTEWLAWFAGVTLEAQRATLTQVEFVIDKSKFLARFAGRLNPRQEKALLRVLREGPSGFQGGLSAGNYRTIARTSSATATRDLSEMTELGAMVRSGERKHARYRASLPVRPEVEVRVGAGGEIMERERV